MYGEGVDADALVQGARRQTSNAVPEPGRRSPTRARPRRRRSPTFATGPWGRQPRRWTRNSRATSDPVPTSRPEYPSLVTGLTQGSGYGLTGGDRAPTQSEREPAHYLDRFRDDAVPVRTRSVPVTTPRSGTLRWNMKLGLIEHPRRRHRPGQGLSTPAGRVSTPTTAAAVSDEIRFVRMTPAGSASDSRSARASRQVGAAPGARPAGRRRRGAEATRTRPRRAASRSSKFQDSPWGRFVFFQGPGRQQMGLQDTRAGGAYDRSTQSARRLRSRPASRGTQVLVQAHEHARFCSDRMES